MVFSGCIRRPGAKGWPFAARICVKTLYDYIDRDLFLGISNKDLLQKKKAARQAVRKVRKVAWNNRAGKSIEERPEEANQRKEFGQWEIDLVVGRQGSITADDSSEFLDNKGLQKAAKCDEVYYAHPFSSWERGSNENGNRILRRFLPKGTDFSTLKPRDLKWIEDWVNNYPRKIFGYKTSNDMYAAAA